MSDNTELNQGQDGDVVRLLDKGGVKTQVVALDVGGGGAEALVSESNRMPVSATGVTSILNTSTVPLSGGATFTGTAELESGPDVMVSCFSDAAGTLYLDFSVNGADWRTFPTSGFNVAAGIHEFHTAVKGPRYFRARFVNGSSAQSVFQLYTYFGTYRQPSAPLNQPLALDSDAVLVRTTLPWLDTSRGLTSGITSIKKFGRNAAVGISYSPIALGGVYQTPQSGAATALRIQAGGNAEDTALGVGARSITIEGLDENFLFANETLATAGASASAPTTTTFTRVYRAHVAGSGTYASALSGSHSGNITIENAAGGTDWATIDRNTFAHSQSEIGAYSVAAGLTAYVFLDDITIDSGKTADVIFFHRGGADETAAPYTAMRAKSVLTGLTGGSTDISGRTVPYGPFVGPCDIGFMGEFSVGTGSIAVEFEIFLVTE